MVTRMRTFSLAHSDHLWSITWPWVGWGGDWMQTHPVWLYSLSHVPHMKTINIGYQRTTVIGLQRPSSVLTEELKELALDCKPKETRWNKMKKVYAIAIERESWSLVLDGIGEWWIWHFETSKVKCTSKCSSKLACKVNQENSVLDCVTWLVISNDIELKVCSRGNANMLAHWYRIICWQLAFVGPKFQKIRYNALLQIRIPFTLAPAEMLTLRIPSERKATC